MGPSWEGVASPPLPPPPHSSPLNLSLGRPRQASFTDEEREASILTAKHVGLRPNGTLFSFSCPGAKERTHQQKKHNSYEDELSEVLEKPNDQAEPKGQCRPVWP